MENNDGPKRIYKIEDGKLLAGVCGGIAEYFHFDPTLVRLGWAVLSLFWGTGILLYIICAIVFPKKSDII